MAKARAMIELADGATLISGDDGGLFLALLPSPRDGKLDEYADVLDSLPDDLCILFDRQTLRRRILRLGDDGLPNFAEHFESKRRAALRFSNDAAGELGEAPHDEPGPQHVFSVITRHVIGPPVASVASSKYVICWPGRGAEREAA